MKSTSESEDDDEERDRMGEAPAPDPPMPIRSARTSVSAEVYGEYNKKKPFVPPNFPKTPEQHARILQKIQQSFLFNTLDNRELEIIVAAM